VHKFCILKSSSLVIDGVALAKIGITSVSYLPVSTFYVSIKSPLTHLYSVI